MPGRAVTPGGWGRELIARALAVPVGRAHSPVDGGRASGSTGQPRGRRVAWRPHQRIFTTYRRPHREGSGGSPPETHDAFLLAPLLRHNGTPSFVVHDMTDPREWGPIDTILRRASDPACGGCSPGADRCRSPSGWVKTGAGCPIGERRGRLRRAADEALEARCHAG